MGTKLLGFSIGRGSGALKELRRVKEPLRSEPVFAPAIFPLSRCRSTTTITTIQIFSKQVCVALGVYKPRGKHAKSRDDSIVVLLLLVVMFLSCILLRYGRRIQSSSFGEASIAIYGVSAYHLCGGR